MNIVKLKKKTILWISATLLGLVSFIFLLGPKNICTYSGPVYPYEIGSDLAALKTALKMYKRHHGGYPNSLEDLVGNYLDRMILDPWGNEYKYKLKQSSNQTGYEVISLGRDQKLGGDNENSDTYL